MTVRKPTQYKPKNWTTVISPGKVLPYDVDRGLVEEVSAACNINNLIESLRDKDEESARIAFKDFGAELMRLTIELADTKYLDRCAEMIEIVAKQTGISFPHRFERYIELGLIAARPLDKWNIVKATTRELVLQVYGCAVHQALVEAGLKYERFPCQAICRAGFKVAAEKLGDPIEIEMTKTLANNRMCEFSFNLQSLLPESRI